MAVKDSTYGATASPAPANVQIIAPATLQAGFTFDAMYEGATFPVTVPMGGVTKGQTFIVPFAPHAGAAIAVAVPAADAAADFAVEGRPHSDGGRGIPTGAWRDDLCDCCRLGAFHPSCWMATCLTPLLVGQVLTRMQMTWLGQRMRHGKNGGSIDDSRPESNERWRCTFRNIVIVTALFYGISTLTAPTDGDVGINSWLTSLFNWYVLYLLIQLRATVRHVYSIPEERCLCLYGRGACGGNPREGVCGGRNNESKLCAAGVPVGWEDICAAVWCQLCVVAQLARHTADYKERQARWCNNVGVLEWDDDEAYAGAEAGVGEGSVLVV